MIRFRHHPPNPFLSFPSTELGPNCATLSCEHIQKKKFSISGPMKIQFCGSKIVKGINFMTRGPHTTEKKSERRAQGEELTASVVTASGAVGVELLELVFIEQREAPIRFLAQREQRSRRITGSQIRLSLLLILVTSTRDATPSTVLERRGQSCNWGAKWASRRKRREGRGLAVKDA